MLARGFCHLSVHIPRPRTYLFRASPVCFLPSHTIHFTLLLFCYHDPTAPRPALSTVPSRRLLIILLLKRLSRRSGDGHATNPGAPHRHSQHTSQSTTTSRDPSFTSPTHSLPPLHTLGASLSLPPLPHGPSPRGTLLPLTPPTSAETLLSAGSNHQNEPAMILPAITMALPTMALAIESTDDSC